MAEHATLLCPNKLLVTKLVTQITVPKKFCVQCKPKPKLSSSARKPTSTTCGNNLLLNKQALLSSFPCQNFKLCCVITPEGPYIIDRISTQLSRSYHLKHHCFNAVSDVKCLPNRQRASLLEWWQYNWVLVILWIK